MGPSSTLVDSTFPDPTAPAYNNASFARVEVIKHRAERGKETKYGDEAAAKGYCFGAFAIEIFLLGCLGY